MSRAETASTSRPVRPGCWAAASSSTPTCRPGLGRARNGRPRTVAVPDDGAVSPHSMRSVVDFPAPLGPRKPVTRPGRAVKDTSSTAVTARPRRAYRLVRCSAVIMVTTVAGTGGGARPAAGSAWSTFGRSRPGRTGDPGRVRPLLRWRRDPIPLPAGGRCPPRAPGPGVVAAHLALPGRRGHRLRPVGGGLGGLPRRRGLQRWGGGRGRRQPARPRRAARAARAGPAPAASALPHRGRGEHGGPDGDLCLRRRPGGPRHRLAEHVAAARPGHRRQPWSGRGPPPCTSSSCAATSPASAPAWS